MSVMRLLRLKALRASAKGLMMAPFDRLPAP